MKLIKYFGRLFILACVIATGVIVYNQYVIFTYEAQVYEELTQEIDVQQTLRENLLHELEHLLSDEYIERMARNQLGFVRPNEILFIPMN